MQWLTFFGWHVVVGMGLLVCGGCHLVIACCGCHVAVACHGCQVIIAFCG
jgi:hypothetical protein